ncbi:MAG: hypothetical protein J7500_15215 [Sphingomonas sp.]|uniref:hypothetical protein n=1 Tax=Sphingomonas sp. TaxID=28214 RepID=UPI001B01DFC5|nr:hypothetical protein [Sphingomonas sp.]MBO9624056.1 hypothetical protein [Sphingomonas sp.]
MRIVPLVFAAALLLPLPAAAQSLGSPTGATAPRPRAGDWGGTITQPRGGYRTERAGEAQPGYGYARELGNLRREIRQAQDNGQITRREERALLRESRRVGGFGYRAGGFSGPESRAVRERLEMLRSQVSAARTRGISRQR